jgi:hypothetical protein
MDPKREGSTPRPGLEERLLAALRVDFAPGSQPPSVVLLGVASVAAVVLSLAADAGLVALGTRAFPSTKGYGHFAFADYSRLTIIGVVVACAVWPAVARITSTPRPAFLRMAILVTIALWMPDLWLLARHQPPRAVGVLMGMHLAIALVTYNLLVHVAPVRTRVDGSTGSGAAGGAKSAISGDGSAAPGRDEGGVPRSHQPIRTLCITMAIAVAVELALGLATLVVVPIGRPDGLIPTHGRLVYVAHAGVGLFLIVGATALVITSRQSSRVVRIGVVMGGVGILLGACGGVLAIYHPARPAGLALMFLGTVISGIGYLGPVIESLPSH